MQRTLKISLRLLSIVSDERCAARVTCSWENPPVIVIEASAPSQSTKVFEIAEGGPKGRIQGTYAGITIQYADLTPVPEMPVDFSVLKPLTTYTVRLRLIIP